MTETGVVRRLTAMRVLVVFMVLAGWMLQLGCGSIGGGSGNPAGGGESGGEEQIPGSTPAPGTHQLTTVGSVLVYPQVAGYAQFMGSITFEIPTPTRQERFGLVLASVQNTVAEKKVTVAPLSYVRADLRPAALRAPSASVRGLRYRQSNQIDAEQELRQQRRSAVTAQQRANLVPLASSGLPDHSGETLFSEVSLNLYSRGVSGSGPGPEYTRRTAVLRRIGAHCKIFVDAASSPRGLDAVAGPDAISETELDQLVYDFDNVAWPLLSEGYGPVWDIDQDQRVSFIFSPLYNDLGFAGLFDTAHLELWNVNSNRRDMVVIFTPDTSGLVGHQWLHDQWLAAARETMVHECQHLINYSSHFNFNKVGDGFEETVWLDEALSVGAEARFRIERGDPPGEDRFDSWTGSRPSSYSLLDFSWDVSKYGMLGLWGHYLYEQGGTTAIKELVQARVSGIDNVNARFSNRGGMAGLFPDWAAAVFVEGLRRQNMVDHQAIDSRYKYQAALDFPLAFTSLPFGSRKTFYIRGYGVAFQYMSPPSDYDKDVFRFVVHAPDVSGLRCILLRLQ